MASVITNVTLDHMESLGDTSKIAVEKAGIIKETGLVVRETKESVLMSLEKKRRGLFCATS